MTPPFDYADRLRRRSNLVLALAFLAIGSVGLVLAATQLVSVAMLFARTNGTTGTYVESVDRQAAFNGGTFHHARFRFRSTDGKERYATAMDGSTSAPVVGSTALIRYEPAAPDHATVCSFWFLWVGPLFCGTFGLVFGLPGLAILIRQRRSE